MSNLQLRMITASCLIAALAGILFYLPSFAAPIAFAVIAACAAWEWGGFMRQSPSARVLYGLVTLLFCWQIYIFSSQWTPVLLMLSVVFWFIVVPLWLSRKWTLRGNDFLAYIIGFIVILPTWSAMTYLNKISPWVLVATMMIVWIADIGAYFTGRLFGRHKLAPMISPGKTWEGVAGAMIGVAVYGVCLMNWAPSFVTKFASNELFSATQKLGLEALLLLPLLTGISVLGDLFESLLKRQVGVKDSSALLPGHGGVLDRIDSLTSTLPFAALLMYLLSL